MLKQLRHKKTAKKIWITLAILILPAFILWGSGSLISNKEADTFAGQIFGRRIPFSEYKDALDAARNQAVIQFGEEFSEKDLNLKSLAWERLLLLYEAKKRKLSANDKEVIAAIESYPFFQRKGQFDNGIYSQMLQYVFHTQPRVFEEQARQNLIIGKLYTQATRSVKLADEETKEAYRKLYEQISLYYISGQYPDFIKDLNPSDEEVKEYFRKNSLRFKQPLSFNLEYISIETDGKDVKSAQENVKKIARQVNKKTDFAKIAKAYNYSLKETGFFGLDDPIPGIGWSPEILGSISKARAGELLPLTYMDKNYYILRLKERKDSYIPDFAAIKDTAKAEFIKDKAEGIAEDKIEKCFNKLKEDYQIKPGSLDFETIARQFGLKSGSTGLFRFGSYIEGIGASDAFWAGAQKLKEGEFSQALYTPSGVYIIKLKSRVPVDEKKFSQEKEEFAKTLLLQKKHEYFIVFMKGLAKRAQLF